MVRSYRSEAELNASGGQSDFRSLRSAPIYRIPHAIPPTPAKRAASTRPQRGHSPRRRWAQQSHQESVAHAEAAGKLRKKPGDDGERRRPRVRRGKSSMRLQVVDADCAERGPKAKREQAPSRCAPRASPCQQAIVDALEVVGRYQRWIGCRRHDRCPGFVAAAVAAYTKAASRRATGGSVGTTADERHAERRQAKRRDPSRSTKRGNVAARNAPTAIIVSVSNSVLMSAIRIEGTHLRTAATRRITDIALPGTYLPR